VGVGETCAAAVGNAPVAGPDTASPTSPWASSLAADEPANGLAAVMVHDDPVSHRHDPVMAR
jgi:hypothetical protein